ARATRHIEKRQTRDTKPALASPRLRDAGMPCEPRATVTRPFRYMAFSRQSKGINGVQGCSLQFVVTVRFSYRFCWLSGGLQPMGEEVRHLTARLVIYVLFPDVSPHVIREIRTKKEG